MEEADTNCAHNSPRADSPILSLHTLHHPPHRKPISPAMQPSLDSQQSLDSQMSLQSQPSRGLLAHMTTLGFLPSLASYFSDAADSATMDHRCIATIRGEQGCLVSSLAVVGDYLYAGTGSSASSSNSIRVWQKISMKECAGFGTGCAAVKALVVSGDRILSAHQDRKIRIWSRDKTPGAKRLRPKQVSEGDNHVRQDADLQAVNAADNSHKLMASMPTVKDYLKTFIPPKNYVQVRRHHKRLWIEHVDTISMLAVGGATTDPILYSASWDCTIKVWNLSDFTCIESFKAHDDAINALVVAPDGFLYSASADAKVKVWARQGETNGKGQLQQIKQKQKHFLAACLEAHKLAVNALSLIKEREGSGLTLYSGGSDRGIVVWERGDGTQHMVASGVLRGHRNAVLCLASAGSVLCSGGADRTIRVWRRWGAGGGVAHSCVALLQGHGGPVKCLSLSVDAEGGHLLYSSSLDHEIKLWQLSGFEEEYSHGNGKADEDEGINVALISKQESVVSPWKFPSV